MTLSLDTMAFDDDWNSLRDATDASRWELGRGSAMEVFATMRPVGSPAEAFSARLAWTMYPGVPSIKFREPATGRLDVPTAWPTGGPFRPAACCICANYTAEGFQMHIEWVDDPRFRWTNDGNVIVKALRLLQDDLDQFFAGRHK